LSPTEQPAAGGKVSFNSKSVLLGLFALVAIIVVIYTLSILAYNPEQSSRINTPFIAAVSGSLALGGTLISQLWGRETVTNNSPRVHMTNPIKSADGVPVDIRVTATFNKVMDAESIKKAFTLKNDKNKPVLGDVQLEGGAVAIFKPNGNLDPNTTYTATINKDAKDSTGNSLQAPEEWTFTTGGGTETPATTTPATTKRPVANDTKETITADKPKEVQLDAVHPDNKPMSYTIDSKPSHGELSDVSSNGKVTYTPKKPDYFGPDSFTFKVNDADKVESNVATVNITITKAP
jgi:hypothetical protein